MKKHALAVLLVALSAPVAAEYHLTTEQAQLAHDERLLLEVVSCDNRMRRDDFNDLMLRMQANVTAHHEDPLHGIPKGVSNADYTFPKGLKLIGMPVRSISARTEHTTPDGHSFTAYGVVFEGESAERIVRRFAIQTPEGVPAIGQRKGWFNQHDLKVRSEAGLTYLTCGYKVRTMGREIRSWFAE